MSAHISFHRKMISEAMRSPSSGFLGDLIFSPTSAFILIPEELIAEGKYKAHFFQIETKILKTIHNPTIEIQPQLTLGFLRVQAGFVHGHGLRANEAVSCEHHCSPHPESSPSVREHARASPQDEAVLYSTLLSDPRPFLCPLPRETPRNHALSRGCHPALPPSPQSPLNKSISLSTEKLPRPPMTAHRRHGRTLGHPGLTRPSPRPSFPMSSAEESTWSRENPPVLDASSP